MPALQLLFVFAVAITTVAATLPSYVGVCKANDPKLDECFTNTIKNLQPYLKKGIPELKVPPMDPLQLSKVEIPQFFEDWCHLELENIKVRGAGDFKLINIHVNLKENKFSGQIEIPHLEYEGDYNLEATFMNLTIKGKGNVKGNAVNSKGEFFLEGELKEHTGEKFFHFLNLDVVIHAEKVHANVNGLINGEIQMGDHFEGHPGDLDLWHLLKPIIEHVVSDVALGILDDIAETVKVNELFPQ